LQLRLLPAVDLVMGLLWSRPGGLSLRTTWVTPATIALGLLVGGFAGIAGLAAILVGTTSANLGALGGGLLACVLALGAGTVALFGIRQRLIR
jgi:hypothetical protein